MTGPALTPEQRELSEADHDALVDTICLALPQPHRGTCNRVADAVAPTVARMVADARAVGDRQGAARVTALVSALQRTEANLVAAVNGRPVRDMAENLAENRAALALATQPPQRRSQRPV